MGYVSQDDKKKLAPAIKAVLKKYDMKGTISVRHHSSLVVTIKSGQIDFSEYMNAGEYQRDYLQVNEAWIDRHYDGIQRDFLNELAAAMKGPDFFDESDIMTDYFHRSHYIDINIGKFDAPYVCTGNKIPAELLMDASKPAYIIQTV